MKHVTNERHGSIRYGCCCEGRCCWSPSVGYCWPAGKEAKAQNWMRIRTSRTVFSSGHVVLLHLQKLTCRLRRIRFVKYSPPQVRGKMRRSVSKVKFSHYTLPSSIIYDIIYRYRTSDEVPVKKMAHAQNFHFVWRNEMVVQTNQLYIRIILYGIYVCILP